MSCCICFACAAAAPAFVVPAPRNLSSRSQISALMGIFSGDCSTISGQRNSSQVEAKSPHTATA